MDLTSYTRALVVDDELLQRVILSRMLQGCGIQADCVGTISDATDKLQQSIYDVVLLDLSLRDDDSLSILHSLAQVEHTPIVLFISGMDGRVRAASSRLAEALGLAVAGTLSKPVSLPALRDLLLAAVPCGRRPISSARGLLPTATDLATALDAGELSVHYQPKVAFASGAVVGVEALSRWHRPDGAVSPDVFIPMAEESGLIQRLTRRVLHAALKTCSQLRAGPVPNCGVAVNVSAAGLDDGVLTTMVDDALAENRVPPGALTIELTESAAISNPVATAECLTRLRIRGVNLSIDDFGTGHSSLLSLLRLPFSELKIDKSFVLGWSADAEAGKIVRATLALARELGLRTVAEGVETSDSAHALTRAGCDTGQGWLFGKPMDRATLLEFVSGGTAASAAA